MDEQDLRQFQQYVKEFSNVAGDKRTSQGLANLVMIQKELGGQKLSPVQLDDDKVYSTSKSGSLGLVRDMKVQLAGSTDETFTPLIQGLRRSTLNVRLKNSFRDIIDPLVNELQIQQLEKMTYENELHREDVIYYRQMIHAIDNLGKKNQHSFLDSVLVGYRRFVRNPIWTSLSFAVNTLRKAIVGPIFGILTGWREKSDTQKIIEAINKQTEFLRTGKIGAQGFMEKFTEGGVLGVIGKSISDTFKAAFGRDAAASPQQQTNTLLGELLDSSRDQKGYLDKLTIVQRTNLRIAEMIYGKTNTIETNSSVIAEGALSSMAEANRTSNLMLVLQKAQLSISQAIEQHSIDLQKNSNYINEEILINSEQSNNHLKSIFEAQQIMLGQNRMAEQEILSFHNSGRTNGIQSVDVAGIMNEVAMNHYEDSKIDQDSFFNQQKDLLTRLKNGSPRNQEQKKVEGETVHAARRTADTLGIMAAVQQEYYEEVAQEQLEEQRQQTKELSEHNRREKRRTLLNVLKAALPGVLGILGLGAGAWYLIPDKAKEVIGDSVYWGMSQIWNNMDLGNKLFALGTSMGVLATLFKSVALGKAALAVGVVWLGNEVIKGLVDWARGKQDDPSPAELMREAREAHGPLGSSLGMQWDSRFALTQENQRALLENQIQAIELEKQNLRLRADETGEYQELDSSMNELQDELKNLQKSLRDLGKTSLMQGMISPVALHSALSLTGNANSSGGSSSAPQGRTTNKTQFMDRYGSMITQIANDLGVDPSIIAGQFALETGWGRSLVGNNNLGNIKAGSSWDGEVVFAHDKAEGSYDPYRSYGSPEEFAADYSSMIRRNFPGAVGAGSDVGAFAGGMQSGRYGAYATDPNYADKLSSVVKSVPSSGPSLSQSTIDSATSRVTNTPSGSSDNFVNKLLGNISQGITTLIEVTKERGESSPFGSSDRGTSHAAYGE